MVKRQNSSKKTLSKRRTSARKSIRRHSGKRKTLHKSNKHSKGGFSLFYNNTNYVNDGLKYLILLLEKIENENNTKLIIKMIKKINSLEYNGKDGYFDNNYCKDTITLKYFYTKLLLGLDNTDLQNKLKLLKTDNIDDTNTNINEIITIINKYYEYKDKEDEDLFKEKGCIVDDNSIINLRNEILTQHHNNL